MKDDVALRIRECLNEAKNKKIVNDIISKMGRVLEKKRALSNEQPVLVFENRIWLGNYSYANNREFLQMNEVKTVISCLEMSLSLYLPDVTYQRFDLKDSADERFEEAVKKFIDFVDKQQGAIYIHCFSGRSRSPALLLAYIMYRQGKTYDEAIEGLRKVYPIATPNAHFQSILRKIVFNQVETKNLLDENVEQIPSSPRRPIEHVLVQSPSKKEINLLQIKWNEIMEEKTQLNLLQQTVPSVAEQSSVINIDSTPSNTINIFQMQKEEDKPNVNNNVQLLDFNQQTQPIHQQIQIQQQTVSTQIQKVLTVQDNQIDLETKPEAQTISEQLQKPTESISEAKTQSVNLLQEPTPQVKVQKEQSFADNTDFTQKKVKKNKKKR